MVHRLTVLLLLLWLLISGLFLAWHDSLTTDEGVHIASGYLALTRHDFRFDPEHPFLFKALSALPVLALHPHLPPGDQALWQPAASLTYDSWREAREWGDEWLFQSGNNPEQMLFMARLPSVLILVLLGALLYWLVRLWLSRAVGLAALFALAFNPTVLAHGHLANDDVPLAFMVLLFLYALWRYVSTPTLRSAFWLALTLTASLLVKFSALSLVVITAICLLYVLLVRRLKLTQWLWQVLLIAILSLALIWLAYLGQPLPHFPGFNWFRALFPREFTKGVLLVLLSSLDGRPAYLLGQFHSAGTWYYFPVLFLLKTQVSGLLLIAVGAFALLRQKIGTWQRYAPGVIGLTAIVIAGLAITSKLNIGIRHIMPLLVLSSIVMGAALVWLWQGRWRWLVPIFAVLYIIPVLGQFSNLVGFSNLFIQPTSSAYQYFNDSNLDWGIQAKAVVALVQKDFPGEPLYMNYFWNPYILQYYGLHPLPLDIAHPPHHALIGVTATQLTFPDYDFLRSLTPVAHTGNTTFFYRL